MRGLGDPRTFALFRAGSQLLARSDYDDVSIARLTREAGCSVGAFYLRFKTKEAFLRFLIVETFAQVSVRADRVLNADVTGRGVEAALREIVALVVNELSEPNTAGVLRAAIKLGGRDLREIEPFIAYRKGIADRAASLFVPSRRSRAQKTRAREAVQMVFGILADAVLLEAGPMRSGSARLKEVLGSLAVSHVQDMSSGSPKSDVEAPSSRSKRESSTIYQSVDGAKLRRRGKVRVL